MNKPRTATLFQILSFLAVLAMVFAPVTPAFAQGATCDPSDGVSCWKLDYNHKVATWVGPTDGSADVFQKGAVLGLIRSGWTFKVPNWQVPGNVEICVGSVNGQSKGNCDGTEMSVKPGNIVVTGSTGDSGGFRLKPASGYGYNAGQPETLPSITDGGQNQPSTYPQSPNWSLPAFAFPEINWNVLIAMLFAMLGLLWAGICGAFAFVRFNTRFGFWPAVLAALLAGILSTIPCLGILVPVITWLVTRPPSTTPMAS